MREVVQQVLARREVPVERPDSHACIFSDRRHPYPEAFAMDGGGCRLHERVTVERSIAALLMRAPSHLTGS